MTLFGQAFRLSKPFLNDSTLVYEGLGSNGVTQIAFQGDSLTWFATGGGLSKTSDFGRSFSSYYGGDFNMPRGGISALATLDSVIWVAGVFDSKTDLGSQQTGGGLAYSKDYGETWTYVPQPQDVIVSVLNMSGSPGDVIDVPLRLTNVDDKSIQSYEIEIIYDSAELTFAGISQENTIAESWKDPDVTLLKDKLIIRNSSDFPLTMKDSDDNSDNLLFLKFQCDNTSLAKSIIRFANIVFNQGNPIADWKSATFTINSDSTGNLFRIPDASYYASSISSLPVFFNPVTQVKINSVKIIFCFDPEVVTLLNAKKGPVFDDDWNLTTQTIENGKITVTISSQDSLTLSSDVELLTLSVFSRDNDNQTSRICIDDVRLNGEVINKIIDNALIFVVPQNPYYKERVEFQSITTPINNTTWDISLCKIDDDSIYVYITSWAGGLRRSRNYGATWQRLPLPSDEENMLICGEVIDYDIDPRDPPVGNHNHKGFSVLADSNTIWVGTANGVNLGVIELDGCISWQKYNAQNSNLSGNFIIALARQYYNGQETIWVGALTAESGNEIRAVNKTTDSGLSWTRTLVGERIYNFAFDGPTVYVCTERGLFKSLDGENWALYDPAVDTDKNEYLFSEDVYAAGVDSRKDTTYLWLGTSDGIAKTANDGISWSTYRQYLSTSQAGQPEIYAYPNPFAPNFHNVTGGDGHVRIQYYLEDNAIVKLEIYDFAMDRVYSSEFQSIEHPGDNSIVWNGRNRAGDIVANGTYFCKLTIKENDKETAHWTKLIVVK